MRQADGRDENDNTTRQGLLPDFLYTKQGVRILMDVKTMAMCPTRYNKNSTEGRARAVVRRQKSVHNEYLNKARKADRNYNDHDSREQGNAAGPVETELHNYPRVKGLVVGAFGEVSPDLREFVEDIAEGWAGQWMEMGHRTKEEARAIARHNAKKLIGIQGVRSYAKMKLRRILDIRAGHMEKKQQRDNDARREANFQLQMNTDYRQLYDRGCRELAQIFV